MKVVLETSITRYLDRVEDLLLKQEVTNNLMLGLLERGKNNIGVFTDGIRLGIVEQDGEPIYAFMQTPPNRWILAAIEGVDQDVIPEIVQFLHTNKYPVPGVVGPTEQAEAFAGLWKKATGKQAELKMKQLIYQLDEVKHIPDESGKLIAATDEHLATVRDWLVKFGDQANIEITKPQADSMARTFIQNESLYLWEVDGQIVSMANNSRKSKNGATVNAVFTPDEQKRKGYATNVVAALSQKLLNDGSKFCNLYTDLANPTSNSIYRKIGYYEVGDSVEYNFG
ncbi:GNAT family N-acetyltransferase [Ornithinibacillus contaminans]|uniref:GNAT family N-acetyltransferase n=1 Tax=Ornithinibacillus contaminans TaxID=694055 RepID=UPI00064DF166|nr:GNAT family N-acetyltransferase [Ornithinibacillus contaminans]